MPNEASGAVVVALPTLLDYLLKFRYLKSFLLLPLILDHRICCQPFDHYFIYYGEQICVSTIKFLEQNSLVFNLFSLKYLFERVTGVGN